jgi:hypothetical protein
MTDDALLVRLHALRSACHAGAEKFTLSVNGLLWPVILSRLELTHSPVKVAGFTGKNCRVIHISLTMAGA